MLSGVDCIDVLNACMRGQHTTCMTVQHAVCPQYSISASQNNEFDSLSKSFDVKFIFDMII